MTRLQPHQLAAYQHHLKLGLPIEGFVMPAPIPKKPRNNEESVMQRALVRWWALNCRHFDVPELCLLSIPNGGNGSAKRGSIMKAEGQRKGAPDLMLAVTRTIIAPIKPGCAACIVDYSALFLELKTAKGTLSPEQEVFHEILAKQGYKVVVCITLQQCIDTITTYLE